MGLTRIFAGFEIPFQDKGSVFYNKLDQALATAPISILFCLPLYLLGLLVERLTRVWFRISVVHRILDQEQLARMDVLSLSQNGKFRKLLIM